MNRSFPADQVNPEVLLVLGLLTRMRKHGFTNLSYCTVLFAVGRMEATVSQITEWTAFKRSNTTHLIQDLQKDGLVEKVPGTKRKKGGEIYRLTDDGLRAIDDITGDLLKAATLLVQ